MERGSGGAALWWPVSPASPPTLASSWCPASTAHTKEDNMAAADRNLLLEPRIKATEPDRNLLSNIHKVDANRKTGDVWTFVRVHSVRQKNSCELQQ